MLRAVPDPEPDVVPLTHQVIEIMGPDGTQIPYANADDFEIHDTGALVLLAENYPIAAISADAWTVVERKTYTVGE